MNDLFSDLIAKSGLDPNLAQQGMGAIFAQLKGALPSSAFQEVQEATPGSEQMMSAFDGAQTQTQSEASALGGFGGGVLGQVANIAGSLFGDRVKSFAGLIETLSKLGFSLEQVQSFLPQALAFFQKCLSPDLLQKLLSALPSLAGASSATSSSATSEE